MIFTSALLCLVIRHLEHSGEPESDNGSMLSATCSIKVIVLVVLAPRSVDLPAELLTPVHKVYSDRRKVLR